MFEISLVILLVGLLICVAAIVKCYLGRIGLPAMLGYIVLGAFMRVVASGWGIDEGTSKDAFEFLAEVGVIVLLFRIGLESNLQKLLSQLRQATFIGLIAIGLSGLAGFAVAYWVLGLETVTSLIVAAAFTATSVGIPAVVWEEARKVDTDEGQLFLDTAELDDVLGVTIMALLFVVVPILQGDTERHLLPALGKTAVTFLIKLTGFALACVAFAHFFEKPVTRFAQKLETKPDPTLTVVAIGFIIAAFAGLLGFSVAVGAFFAGLVFSRDPQSVKDRTAFSVVFDLFVPFFFIGIGLKTSPNSISPALLPSLLLFAAAFASKFVGTATPALLTQSRQTSTLLGLSMVPRAEITLIIMQRSLALKADVMPERIFSAMVITSIATCVVAPVILRRVLPRYLEDK